MRAKYLEERYEKEKKEYAHGAEIIFFPQEKLTEVEAGLNIVSIRISSRNLLYSCTLADLSLIIYFYLFYLFSFFSLFPFSLLFSLLFSLFLAMLGFLMTL